MLYRGMHLFIGWVLRRRLEDLLDRREPTAPFLSHVCRVRFSEQSNPEWQEWCNASNIHKNKKSRRISTVSTGINADNIHDNKTYIALWDHTLGEVKDTEAPDQGYDDHLLLHDWAVDFECYMNPILSYDCSML